MDSEVEVGLKSGAIVLGVIEVVDGAAWLRDGAAVDGLTVPLVPCLTGVESVDDDDEDKDAVEMGTDVVVEVIAVEVETVTVLAGNG